MYKTLHDQADPRHVVVGIGRSLRTSKQVHAYLLCEECEDRFNKGGENWINKNILQPSGDFPLQAALRNAEPKHLPKNGRAYAGDTPGVDIERLTYFAASMFWRAAVYHWKRIHDWFNEDQLDLGPYEEELRLYLLGQKPFPEKGALVIYVADETPYAGATCPNGGRTFAGYHQFSFHAPGVLFFLLLGQLIPPNIKHICSVRSEERLLLLTSDVDRLFRKAAFRLLETIPDSLK